MELRGIYVVGARLLGLYLILRGITSLPQIIVPFEIEGPLDPVRLAVLAAASLVLLIGIGSFLLYRYPITSGAVMEQALTPEALFLVGVRLLGVYFVVSGLVSLTDELVDAMHTDFAWPATRFAGAVLYAVVGAFLALRPAVVARAIRAAA